MVYNVSKFINGYHPFYLPALSLKGPLMLPCILLCDPLPDLFVLNGLCFGKVCPASLEFTEVDYRLGQPECLLQFWFTWSNYCRLTFVVLSSVSCNGNLQNYFHQGLKLLKSSRCLKTQPTFIFLKCRMHYFSVCYSDFRTHLYLLTHSIIHLVDMCWLPTICQTQAKHGRAADEQIRPFPVLMLKTDTEIPRYDSALCSSS